MKEYTESAEVLYLPVKQNFSILSIQRDLWNTDIYLVRNSFEEILQKKKIDFEFYERRGIQADRFFQTAEKLFSHLKPERHLLPSNWLPVHDYHTYRPYTKYALIAVFVRTFVEICLGLHPDVSSFVDTACYHADDIAKEGIVLLNEENVKHVISHLEKMGKIDVDLLTFLSTLADCFSDKPFIFREAFPEKLLERVEVEPKTTFYFQPQLIALLKKRYSCDKCLKLADKAEKIYVLFNYCYKSLPEEVKKISLPPEEILKLIYRASENKLKLDFNSIELEDELNFSWTLVYTFNWIFKHLSDLKENKQKRIVENILSFKCYSNVHSEKIKNVLGRIKDIYSKYIQTVNSIEKLDRIDRELLIFATHIKLLDLMNFRETNLVFLNHLVELMFEEKKSKNSVAEETIHFLTSRTLFLERLGSAFVSLEGEDLPLVEKLASLLWKTPFPKALFLFYPWIGKSEVYDGIVKIVTNTKKEGVVYFTIYEHIYSSKETNIRKREFLKRIKADVEDRLTPGVAFALAEKNIVSDKILEKSKVFTLAGEKYRKSCIKAECLNICGVKDLPGVARKIIEYFLGNKYVLYASDFIRLGRELSRILTNEEFEVVVRFINYFLGSHSIYLLESKAVSQEVLDWLSQETNSQKFLSAIRKIKNNLKQTV